MTTTSHQEPATEKQIRFIQVLFDRKNMDDPRVPKHFDFRIYDPSRLTKGAAGRFIETLKALPDKPRQLPQGSVHEAKTELEAGFYVIDRQVYKVIRAVHGSGHLYAKKLMVPATYEERGRWVHAPGAMRELREFGVQLTLQVAQELGQLYGMCVKCGATLTDEESIERGMGPVCYAKMGGS